MIIQKYDICILLQGSGIFQVAQLRGAFFYFG